MAISGSPLTEPSQSTRSRYSSFFKLAGVGVALAMTLVAVPNIASAAPIVAPYSGSYVALGDSYTSGVGVATSVSDSGACSRSDHNYPSLVAAAIKPTSFKDVSCAGATTDNILNASFGTAAQLDAVTATTGLVTIGIGGNDTGLISVGVTCVILSIFNSTGSPCKDNYTSGGTNQVQTTIDTAAPKIAAVVKAVKAKAPLARILVVGYPDVVPISKTTCNPAVDAPLAAGDAPFMYGVLQSINTMLSAQAKANGAEFVDIFTPSIGHDACQAVGVRYTEAIANITNGAPLHPNGTGHAAFAKTIEAQLAAS
jgi:lysophospholipase L1-like esterase